MGISRMRVGAVKALVDRTYRESEPLQFLRELVANSIEAGATKIEVGPDVEGGLRTGIWRFMIRDNGRGMDADQMIEYLNTYGGGGKLIGSAHGNFGIGSKASLLPWNRSGVVVISYTTRTPGGSMVRLRYDEEADDYGAHLFDGDCSVVPPFQDDDLGIDWAALRPGWMKTGTIVILLGNAPTESTYLGRGTVKHVKKRWAVRWLSRRYWAIPDGLTLTAWRFVRSPPVGPSLHTHKSLGGRTRVLGGLAIAEDLAIASGLEVLPDGTRLSWYLRPFSKDLPADVRKHRKFSLPGGIAALYGGELYEIKQNVRTGKSWGLTPKLSIRTLIVLEPPPLADGVGVCPDSSRSRLLMRSESNSVDLPWGRWREWWRERIPDVLAEEMRREVAAAATPISHEMLDRIEAAFSGRWRIARPSKGGGQKAPGPPPGPSDFPTEKTSEAHPLEVRERNKGDKKARARALPEAIWPDEWVHDKAAAVHFVEPSSTFPSGLLLCNSGFWLIQQMAEHHAQGYAPHQREQVAAIVREVYQVDLACRVAHTRADRRRGRTKGVKCESFEALLTRSLFGLVSHEEMIKARLVQRIGAASS